MVPEREKGFQKVTGRLAEEMAEKGKDSDELRNLD